jgi:hypothetical protein
MKYKPAVETSTNKRKVAARRIRRLVTVRTEKITMIAAKRKNMN